VSDDVTTSAAVLTQVIDQIVEAERAKIVAWLRRTALEGGMKISPQDFDALRSDWVDALDGPNIVDGDPWDASLRAAADAIEAGEHEGEGDD
jgi:hypothetical protein